MKYCPKCNREYDDETLQFCLEDGTPLSLKSYDTNDLRTEQETVVLSNKPEQIKFDISRSEQFNQEQAAPETNPAIQTAPEKSNTFLIVGLTALIMIVLFGLVGFGAYFLMNGEDSNVAQKNTRSRVNKKNSSANSNKNDKNSEVNSASETPQKEEKTTPKPTATPAETTISEVDVEEIKKGIAGRLTSWKTDSEAVDLGNYMNNYADRIDYYNKNDASKSFVRNDKQRAFNMYDSMKVNLSNVVISASKDGETATVSLDKEWNFSGEENNSSGKVRQQLKLKKDGENWLITSEKDLKTYYVNK